MFSGGNDGGGDDGGGSDDPQVQAARSLVAAGYFRAQISTLPPFDTLVGGLAWAITLINMEVDLSLEDQASLGQKIKLAEIICKVLARMKCPHQLQPHQIQGLDFPHVLPVLDWLLERVVEVRADTEAAIRRQSVRQFDAAYLLPSDAARLEHKDNVELYVVRVREQFKPLRKMRRAAGKGEADENSRVRGVMMEYGANINELTMQRLEEETEGKKKDQKAKDEEWAQVEEQDKLKLEGLQKLLSETRSGADMAVSNSNIRAVIAMQSEAIQEAQADQAEKAAELEKLRQASQTGQKEAHKRAVGALQKKLSKAEAGAGGAAGSREEMAGKLVEFQTELKKKKAYNTKAGKETKKLEEQEALADQTVLASLKRLVTLNEALKSQEKSFKSNCKAQLKHLTSLTHSLGDVRTPPAAPKTHTRVSTSRTTHTHKHHTHRFCAAFFRHCCCGAKFALRPAFC